MKPLFFRVLWLLLGAFATVAALSFFVFKWVSEELHPGEGRLRHLVEETAEELVESYQEGTLEKLRRRLHHRYQTRAWLLDQNNVGITAPTVPPEILKQINAYPAVVYPYQNTAGRYYIFGQPVMRDGRLYHVILAAKRPPPGSGFFRGFISIPILLIIALAIASAMLSYWILRPLRTLNSVTKSITADKLNVKAPVSLTSRKDAFGDLGTEFNRMTDRVQQTLENQQQLLRDVSHELRSPLARIQVAASLWQQKHGEAKEVDRIQEEVQRLDHLIGKLLKLSRLQNESSATKQKIRLNQLLSDVINDCNFEYTDLGPQAILKSNNPVSTLGDPDLLSSCFENILRNALRHSPSKGIVLVNLEQKQKQIQISFIDQGPGVTAEELHKIFDPFFRGDRAREINAGHHGIGLAIARTVMTLHQGSVSAHINQDGGLTIRCLLPTL